MVWFIFILAAGAVFVAGSVLARNGAVIAERTGIGHVWVGALLVAGVTSLPEITTDSVAILRDSPELATGDLFGSNMANMAVLGIIALAYRRARVIQREALGIVLTASVAIALTSLAALFIIARLEENIAGAFGIGSVVLFLVAAGGLYLFPEFRRLVAEGEAAEAAAGGTLTRAFVLFAAAGAVVFVSAPVLVASAEEIAEITGLADSFVGVAGLAIATSLPELAAAGAAVRIGALDLAVGNLYGSNAFNMSILIWLDALYTKAPLLETIDQSNAVAALCAVLMMMVGLTAMVLRAERRRFPVDPAATLLLVGYVLGVLLVWSVSGR